MSPAAAKKPISERKLAANRANARKSSGPRTAAGKAKVSRNSCRYHLYARTHHASAAVELRAANRIRAALDALPDPAEHPHAARLIYWGTLLEEQARLEAEILDWAARRNNNDYRQAAYFLFTTEARLFCAVEARFESLGRHFEKALRAWSRFTKAREQASASPLLATLSKVFPLGPASIEQKVIAEQTHHAPAGIATAAPFHPIPAPAQKDIAEQTHHAPAGIATAAPFHPIPAPAQKDIAEQTHHAPAGIATAAPIHPIPAPAQKDIAEQTHHAPAGIATAAPFHPIPAPAQEDIAEQTHHAPAGIAAAALLHPAGVFARAPIAGMMGCDRAPPARRKALRRVAARS